MKYTFKLAIAALLLGFAGALYAETNDMKTNETESKNLTAAERSIVEISSLTAKGDLEKLKTALSVGLEAGLTVNEIKEILVQMYAYAGFPRSLNGINTFRTVLDARKAKGIKDKEGKAASPVRGGDKYERGRKTLEKLTGQPQVKPAPGFGEFAPRIDSFLKEHLFADIFDSEVLNHRQREIATISALAAMDGVAPQLGSHISIGMNTGLTESQLNDLFIVIENSVGKNAADIGRGVLNNILKGSTVMKDTGDKTDNTIFGKGEKAPQQNFTGTVYVQPMTARDANNNFSIGNVTFEPGARSNLHTHPAGQTLLVVDGIGLYQEKGKPIRKLVRGDVVVCDKDIEHWHGASPQSQMTHISIANFKDGQNVVWLGPVTDEEYKAEVK